MFKNFARHGKLVLYRLLIRCMKKKKKNQIQYLLEKKGGHRENDETTNSREDRRVALRMDLMRFVRMYLRA